MRCGTQGSLERWGAGNLDHEDEDDEEDYDGGDDDDGECDGGDEKNPAGSLMAQGHVKSSWWS